MSDASHHFVQWSDGSTGNPRTDENVTADISVIAMFTLDTFVVTAAASANGAITPAAQSVDYGGTAVFTVTPDAGYATVVTGDTCSITQTSGLSWTSGPITADCAVSATFAPPSEPMLAIDVTDNRDYARYGTVLEYIVTVANTGTGDAVGVSLSNAMPAQIDAVNTTWVCTGAGSGAVCESTGSGALDASDIVIPAGRTLIWFVAAPVLPDAIGTTIEYSISASFGDEAAVDATDTDTLVIFRSGFEADDHGDIATGVR
jgi:uncharacterized repeat protein (TIGR01451 family)